ncbi:MAG TPA: histidine kinase [Candidatus Eisenbacteria bacterium]|nr:histidine kinase [Candidatus Eisenbacteria bacterium]
MLKRWGRIWFVAFVLWTLLAFLSAAGAHVYLSSTSTPISWTQLLAWNILISSVWSLLTPLVYELARRYTFDRSGWKLSLPIHIVASIILAFIGAVAMVALNPLVTWTKEPSIPFFAHVLSRTFMDIQRYWYVLLITQAIAFYGKYQERQLLSSQLEAQLANAQLEVLKIQLEPHFLFNTLNSIASLARHDGAAAEHMTLQLADLLRMSLDGIGVHEVPLHQELTFLQRYIDIQQVRFHDRLRVETEIDPRTLDTLVPNLILQPLVENAIRHGISPRRAPGLIRIATWRDRDDVWMEIRDNGVGFASGRGVMPPEGVGLRNTRSRLRQLYSDDHAMVLEDAPGGGCTVKIRVPYRITSEEVTTAHAHSSIA